jgi:hypothetical protein
MAHYAFIEPKTMLVVKVITGVDETVTQIDADGNEVGGSTDAWQAFYAAQDIHAGLICRRTSYHAATNGYRGKYAGIGDKWNEQQQIFEAIEQ